MKKIGILFGMEQSFPFAVNDYINQNRSKFVKSELITIKAQNIEDFYDYNVILDRASNDIPFYHSIMMQASLSNVKIVNNPFWNYPPDYFFNFSLAMKLGINVPRTAIIPSKENPPGTGPDSFRNLLYPLNWQEVFDYVGFPAVIKPNNSNSGINAFTVYNENEFFSAYDFTGSNAMILQEYIDFEKYFRIYVIGKKSYRMVDYDPCKPMHLRFSQEAPSIDSETEKEIVKIAIKICSALGYDFNAVDIAIKDNNYYAMSFLNPVPLIERNLMRAEDFNWLAKTTGEYLVSLALEGKYIPSEYTWSQYLKGPKTPPKPTAKRRGRKPKEKIEESK